MPTTTRDTDRALPPFTYLLSKSTQHLKLDRDDPEKSVPKADLGIGAFKRNSVITPTPTPTQHQLVLVQLPQNLRPPSILKAFKHPNPSISLTSTLMIYLR